MAILESWLVLALIWFFTIFNLLLDYDEPPGFAYNVKCKAPSAKGADGLNTLFQIALPL